MSRQQKMILNISDPLKDTPKKAFSGRVQNFE